MPFEELARYVWIEPDQLRHYRGMEYGPGYMQIDSIPENRVVIVEEVDGDGVWIVNLEHVDFMWDHGTYFCQMRHRHNFEEHTRRAREWIADQREKRVRVS